MDLPSLQALVTRSRLLTEVERAYWLTVIAEMKPEHLGKLEQILTAAEKVPLQQTVHDYYSAVAALPA